MDKKTAQEIINNIFNNQAEARDTISLVDYILRRQLLDSSSFGTYEWQEIDDSDPYSDDEAEILTQVAVQEDGPGAYLGGFPKQTHHELWCTSIADLATRQNVADLRDVLGVIVDALDTALAAGANLPDEQGVPFDQEIKF